jgi:hypothetical protein
LVLTSTTLEEEASTLTTMAAMAPSFCLSAIYLWHKGYLIIYHF